MKEFNYINPPLELEASILKKITIERTKTTRLRFAFLSATALFSLWGIIQTGISLWQSFRETGFYEYASLIFSDGTTLTSYWKEFTLSLIESLPLLGLTILLVILATFIWSSTKALRDARFVFSHA